MIDMSICNDLNSLNINTKTLGNLSPEFAYLMVNYEYRTFSKEIKIILYLPYQSLKLI